MLGKLLKYEFKATSRTFIPLYIAIIVVAFINGLVFNVNSEMTNVQGIGILVLGALFLALGVLTIVVTVQRFSKNLLGDEGYLMFTLPVTPKMLIISKTIVSTVWFILSGITSVVSFMALILVSMIKSGEFKITEFTRLWNELWDTLQHEEVGKAFLYFVGIIGLILIVYIIFTITIYLSLSIGQLPMFSRFRKLAPFISFFVIYFGVNLITGELLDFSGDAMGIILLKGYISSIIAIILLFFPTSYILEKKLNIE